MSDRASDTADATDNLDAPPWDRRDWRLVAALVLGILVVYLGTATYGVIQSNDARSASVAAWSLTHRGTLALPGEFGVSSRWWGVEGADGEVYSNRFPGVIAWAVPFHAAHRVIAGPTEVPHPYFLDYAPAGVAAAVASALAVGVAYGIGRRLANRPVALGFAASLGLATPLWSVAADALWPHGITSALLMTTVLASIGPVRGPLVALSTAGTLLTRPHLGAAHAVLGLWSLARRRFDVAGWLVVGGVVGLGGLAWYSQALFGTWLPVAGYDSERVTTTLLDGDVTTTLQGAVLAFVSPERGIFVYTPIVAVLLVGVVAGWRASPGWARASAIAGVVYFALQLRAIRWSGGGGFFSYRTGIETVVLTAPLLLRTWQVAVAPVRWRRLVVAAALVVSVAFHAYGAIADTTAASTKANWDRVIDELTTEHPGYEVPRMPS